MSKCALDFGSLAADPLFEQLEVPPSRLSLVLSHTDTVSCANLEPILDPPDRWERWVPKDTTCFPGFGLVDATANSVSTRDMGTACSLCTPGSASKVVLDDIGRTYTCHLLGV